MPSRSLISLSMVAGAVQAVAAFLITRPILASDGFEVSLGDATAWRGVAVATLAMGMVGLFGLAISLLIRHSTGAIGAVVFVVRLIGALPPDDVAQFLPVNSPVRHVHPGATTLTAGPGTAVFATYLLAVGILAAILFHRHHTHWCRVSLIGLRL